MKEDNKKQDKNSLESLLKRLYNPKKDLKKRKRRDIHKKKVIINKEWAEKNKELEKPLYMRSDIKKKPISPFKKIFFFAILFFSIVLIITGISLLQRRETISTDSVFLEISGKTFVDGGKEIPIFVEIQNINPVPLELTELVLEYPKGADVSGDNNVRLVRNIGEISSKNLISEKFQITLFGEEGESRIVLASLYYRLPGSSAIFQKDQTFSILIRSSPVLLSIDAPESSVQNQQIPIKFDIISNSSELIKDVLFKINYPIGFEFSKSDPEPSFGNNYWFIDDLSPEERRDIIVHGTMYGFKNQSQSFRAQLGIQDKEKLRMFSTVLNTLVHTIAINQSFLDAQIILNGNIDSNIIANSQRDIKGTVIWENTLNTGIRDAKIILNISGNAFDPKKVSLNQGFFDSTKKIIIWDKNTNEELAFLEPDQKGSVSFSIASSSLVDSFGKILEDPKITFSVDVEGIESGGLKREDLSIDNSLVSLNSNLHLLTKILHYSGPFRNSGPMPPKVGRETTYTVTIQVTNTSNTILNTMVKTSLPSYVKWEDKIFPTTESSNLNYNRVTREIEWNLGTVKSGVGVNNTKPREISFQVSVIPSYSQLGDNFKLTTGLELTGKDTWTDTILKEKKTELNNRLLNDVLDIGADGRVVE